MRKSPMRYLLPPRSLEWNKGLYEMGISPVNI